MLFQFQSHLVTKLLSLEGLPDRNATFWCQIRSFNLFIAIFLDAQVWTDLGMPNLAPLRNLIRLVGLETPYIEKFHVSQG